MAGQPERLGQGQSLYFANKPDFWRKGHGLIKLRDDEEEVNCCTRTPQTGLG